jgi:hypothetical protein
MTMKLSEPSGDENNSGLYSVTLKLTENMDNFKSFFSAEDYKGNKSVSKDGLIVNLTGIVK